MNTLSYKTVSANKATADKQWIVVDAEGHNLGRLASITYAIAPDVNNILMSIGFNLFPSSTASIGEQEKLNLMQRAYARLFPGEHW